LWNDRDLFIAHDRFDHFDRGGTNKGTFVGQGVEELGEDSICCEQAAVPQG
jgi:hypothetical protein